MSGQTVYVGVEVARDKIKVSLRPGETFEQSNDYDGVQALVERLKTLDVGMLVVPASVDGREVSLVASVARAGLPVAVVPPIRIQYFLQALGEEASGPEVIAHFADAVRPKGKVMTPEEMQPLDAIFNRRSQLAEMRTSEEKRLNEFQDANIQGEIKAHINWLSQRLSGFDAEVGKVVKKLPIWLAKEEQRLPFPLPPSPAEAKEEKTSASATSPGRPLVDRSQKEEVASATSESPSTVPMAKRDEAASRRRLGEKNSLLEPRTPHPQRKPKDPTQDTPARRPLATQMAFELPPEPVSLVVPPPPPPENLPDLPPEVKTSTESTPTRIDEKPTPFVVSPPSPRPPAPLPVPDAAPPTSYLPRRDLKPDTDDGIEFAKSQIGQLADLPSSVPSDPAEATPTQLTEGEARTPPYAYQPWKSVERTRETPPEISSSDYQKAGDTRIVPPTPPTMRPADILKALAESEIEIPKPESADAPRKPLDVPAAPATMRVSELRKDRPGSEVEFGGKDSSAPSETELTFVARGPGAPAPSSEPAPKTGLEPSSLPETSNPVRAPLNVPAAPATMRVSDLRKQSPGSELEIGKPAAGPLASLPVSEAPPTVRTRQTPLAPPDSLGDLEIPDVLSVSSMSAVQSRPTAAPLPPRTPGPKPQPFEPASSEYEAGVARRDKASPQAGPNSEVDLDLPPTATDSPSAIQDTKPPLRNVAGPKTPLPTVAGPDAKTEAGIDYELFLDCVHCGLCTSACPTYVENGDENDSPRGRIYLMRAVSDKKIELDKDVKRHLDLCLDCRACESACPSGVQYGKLIEPFRIHMEKTGQGPEHLGWLKNFMLYKMTPHRGRMKFAMGVAKTLRYSGADWLLEKSGLANFLPQSLRQFRDMLPPFQKGYGKFPEVLPADGPRRARVALFLGCAGDVMYPQTTLHTAQVLQKNGCEVWIPKTQGCCGALHYHAAQEAPAKQFAEANCQAFLPEGVTETLDAIVVNAAGCGAMLKDYGHLLHDSPFGDRGQLLATKTRDISEFLMQLGPVMPGHPVPVQATYHDACHLCHGQQIRKPPRQLLEMIPELTLKPLHETEICCGAAGSYNLTQPEMAERLGQRKAKNILDTGAQALFAGNVGCLLQIQRYLKKEKPGMWIAHPVDALWASYTGEKTS